MSQKDYQDQLRQEQQTDLVDYEVWVDFFELVLFLIDVGVGNDGCRMVPGEETRLCC